MKIILDGFGGDNSPAEVLKGAALAVREYGVAVAVAGAVDKLKDCAAENAVSLDGIELIDAPESMTMEDAPTEVIRGKKDSSMAVGLRALAEGRGDAFVSAGNTGALVLGSHHYLKNIPGIKRAALAPLLPSTKGVYMLIDAGGNLNCKPETLAHFGVMGSVYMEKILHIQKPRVGLLNIGTEITKGGDLQREAYPLLQNCGVNFTGNVEARQVPLGGCDVCVCDGFTGNCMLKLTEGTGMAFYSSIKRVFLSGAKGKFAAMLVMPQLKAFKKQMDYSEYGGAPLMGIARPVFKAHGSSNAKAFKNAVRQARDFAHENVIGEIEAGLPKIKDTQEPEERTE